MSMKYRCEYAGHPLYYEFLHRSTYSYFKGFVKRALEDIYEAPICSDYALIESGHTLLEGFPDAYIEYRTLIPLTAKYLLRYSACIFHSASFIYQDKAWLLAAPSGVGKTTQYLNWQRLFPGEIQMISGDMPVISTEKDGHLHIWPTSWNGKENIGTREDAPLGGIILLEQGSENLACKASPNEAIRGFFKQFIVIPETEKEIMALTGLMEKMIVDYPVLRYVNLGNDESTIYLRSIINSLSANVSAERKPVYFESEGNAVDASDSKDNANSAEVIPETNNCCSLTGNAKYQGEKIYHTIAGVVQASVAGGYFLVAAKEARGNCPYITEINETSAFLWKQLEKGCTIGELLSAVMQEYDVENPEETREIVESFVREIQELGYLKEAESDFARNEKEGSEVE